MAPNEWLLSLAHDRDGHRRLFDEAGGNLGVAAHRLARARCASRGFTTDVPTRIELRGAAREIVTRAGLDAAILDAARLARECERHGLLVL